MLSQVDGRGRRDISCESSAERDLLHHVLRRSSAASIPQRMHQRSIPSPSIYTLVPERVVPASGHTICGEHIPGGTIVGVSAWVLHRNTDIFGHDVEIFRPERWLNANIEKVREMDRMLSHFGSAGNYTCFGKNIALLEMYKFVPAVIRHFEVRACTRDGNLRCRGLTA